MREQAAVMVKKNQRDGKRSKVVEAVKMGVVFDGRWFCHFDLSGGNRVTNVQHLPLFPNDVYTIVRKNTVFCCKRQTFTQNLWNDDTVKRVFVMKRELQQALQMFKGDGKKFNVVVVEKAGNSAELTF